MEFRAGSIEQHRAARAALAVRFVPLGRRCQLSLGFRQDTKRARQRAASLARIIGVVVVVFTVRRGDVYRLIKCTPRRPEEAIPL